MRTNRDKKMILSAAAAAVLALSACSAEPENSLAKIDNEIAAGDIDPAVTSAIEDEILVDPALVQQSNPNGVRHPERPVQAPYPIDNVTRAGAETPQANAGNPADMVASPCGVPFQHGAQWAERLPADFPAYPGGRVTEAAGADRGTCHVRVVTFATDQSADQVLNWYRGVASRAGFSAEHEVRGGDHMLGGTKAATDGAFLVIVTPEQGGSKVALIVNNGR
jgi:hypothetical protein